MYFRERKKTPCEQKKKKTETHYVNTKRMTTNHGRHRESKYANIEMEYQKHPSQ
jgi:hypothetical protein